MTPKAEKSERPERPYSALDRLFHEPSRLAILATLVGASRGLSFGELKEACALTDGNLSRHLKALEDDGVVQIDKRFVGSRPRTTVHLSRRGRLRFLDYLGTLEKVLEDAAARSRKAEALAKTKARVKAAPRASSSAEARQAAEAGRPGLLGLQPA